MRRVVFLALLAATLLPVAIASAETPAEKQMALQIGNRLKESGQLHNYRIAIKFQDGTAHLEGTVANAEQRRIAIDLAKQVSGVARVDYKIELDNPAAKNNAPIPQNLKPATGNDRFRLSAALDRATQASAEDESSRAMQAYQPQGEPANMPMQRQAMMPNAQMPMQQPMMLNNGAPTNNMGMRRNNMPMPAQMPRMMPVRQASASGVYQAGGACAGCNGGPGMSVPGGGGAGMGGPAPMGFVPQGSGRGPSYDNASMPGYAWPSYASYPNYAALSYPQQYSPTAWPYIGPFYPYPQVPLAWRKVSLEWDDGWWFLDFSSHNSSH